MEHKENGWQRHLLLVVGIGLPFALMVLVLGYRAFLTAAVPAPRYAAVFALDNYYYGRDYFRTEIVDGRLSVIYLAPISTDEQNQVRNNRPQITVFVQQGYAVPARVFNLALPPAPVIDPAAPTTVAPEVPVSLPPELQVEMIAGTTAPDGYVYGLDGDYHSRGVFNELFIGGGYHDTRNAIMKNGRRVPLLFATDNGGYYYGRPMRFLGWIKEPIAP